MNDVDWSDQTIIEQPVRRFGLPKKVVIRRKGCDHIEMAHDTVRQQQLEVERVPARSGQEVSKKGGATGSVPGVSESVLLA